jgi:hypothetical protein
VEGWGKRKHIVATVCDSSELTLVGKGPHLCRTLLNHPLLQRQSQPKLRFKQPVRANWGCFLHNPTVCNARINSAHRYPHVISSTQRQPVLGNAGVSGFWQVCLPCFVPAKRSGVSTAEVNNKSNTSTPTASFTGVDAVALQGDDKPVRLRTIRGKQLLYWTYKTHCGLEPSNWFQNTWPCEWPRKIQK